MDKNDGGYKMIPPYEIWAENPAKKIGDVERTETLK